MDAFTLDALGWFGAGLLLSAYALVSFRKLAPDSYAYQGLNIVASVLLLANTLYYGAYPSSFVNGVWTLIAVVAILSIVKKRTEGVNTSEA